MSTRSLNIDFTVMVDFEKEDDRYVARADQFGMIAFGKTKAEAEKRIGEGLELLGAFFSERSDGRDEAIRYLESRGIEYRIRAENEDALETVEISMSFGVTV